MIHEIGGAGINELESGGEVREEVNKVTEEAIRRIQENQKKAQQIQQEIKKDKALNDKLARFLSFLLKDIKNDAVIKQLYHTFFRIKNTETGVDHIKKSININVTVGMFVPFYHQEIKELQLHPLYEDIRNFNNEVQLTTYITYIKKLLLKYHDNIAIEKESFIKLLIEISEYYQLTEKLSTEKAIEFQKTLYNELQGEIDN